MILVANLYQLKFSVRSKTLHQMQAEDSVELIWFARVAPIFLTYHFHLPISCMITAIRLMDLMKFWTGTLSLGECAREL